VALAQDGSEVSDTLEITITHQITEVENLSLSFSTGQTDIVSGDSIQVIIEITPVDADSQRVELVVDPVTGTAILSEDNYVIGGDPGLIRIIGTSTDGFGAGDTLSLNILSNLVLLDSLQINPEGGSAIIDQDEGSLQLSCQIYPADATNPNYAWSLISGSGSASIDENGLVSAIENGSVYAVALAQDGSDVSDTLEITITHQITEVENLILNTFGFKDSLAIGDSIQILSEVLPVDADSQRVEILVEPVTGMATLNSNDYLIGVSSGQVRIIGNSTDGFGVSDTLYIEIFYRATLVEYIEISTESGDSVIYKLGGKLQLLAYVHPQHADNTEVTWGIMNLTGQARLIDEFFVEGLSNGSFLVTAHASDTSGVFTSKRFYINDQTVNIISISNDQIILYPNPAKDYIRLMGELSCPFSVMIFSIMGNLLIRNESHNSDQILDISKLPAGLYIMKIASGQNSWTGRFTKRL